MSPTLPADHRLLLVKPPYERFHSPSTLRLQDVIGLRGSAFVWWLEDAQEQGREFDFLRVRPASLPLVIVLPPPEQITRTLPLLHQLRRLHSRAVIPAGALDSPRRIRDILNVPPSPFGEMITQFLMRRGTISDSGVQRCVQRIFEIAPEVRSISQLSRRLYTSRRTLGRLFSVHDLPVPSHWLQFARMLHVAMHLQREPHAIFRVAMRMGYPDGFTLSNQMKRLIGFRPSEVRDHIGWEWIVEAWLRREGKTD